MYIYTNVHEELLNEGKNNIFGFLRKFLMHLMHPHFVQTHPHFVQHCTNFS